MRLPASIPSRSSAIVAAALGVAVLVGGTAAPARADFGALASAFVLPEALVARLDGASDAHLAWSLTLPPELAPAELARFSPAESPSTRDQVGNVVSLLGRGFDLGLVGVDDDLVQNRLLLQLRTSLGRRQFLLRCVVRFD